MTESNQSALATALVAAQTELRAITKDSTNPHFKSKFASLDTIIETVRPILAKNGLAIVQGMSAFENNVITVQSELLHVSGESIGTSVYVPLQKADPQGAGAALTYGRRFGISALLCLATDEDDDGNNASRQAARKPAATPRPAQSTQSEPETTVVTSSEYPRVDGKPLGGFSSEELRQIVAKKTHNPRYEKLVAACRKLLAERSLGMTDDAKVERAKASVVADEGDLKFGM